MSCMVTTEDKTADTVREGRRVCMKARGGGGRGGGGEVNSLRVLVDIQLLWYNATAYACSDNVAVIQHHNLSLQV